MDIQPNGDIARLLLKFIIYQGYRSIRFGKVKGHAKRAHIEAGICTVEEAHGNIKSDTIADEGIHLIHPQALNIAKFMAHRHTHNTLHSCRRYMQ